MKEFTPNNGQEIKPPSQSLEEYEKWRNTLLREKGQEIASKFPMFFGRIEFNIQNGKFINWNMTLGGK
jgi:hypothetical protein